MGGAKTRSGNAVEGGSSPHGHWDGNTRESLVHSSYGDSLWRYAVLGCGRRRILLQVSLPWPCQQTEGANEDEYSDSPRGKQTETRFSHASSTTYRRTEAGRSPSKLRYCRNKNKRSTADISIHPWSFSQGNPPEPLQESLTGWQADQAELQKMADAARESPRHQALINQLTYLFTSTSDSAVERRNKQLMVRYHPCGVHIRSPCDRNLSFQQITFIVLVSVQMMLTSYIGFRFRYSPTGSMDDLNSPMNMQRVVFPILAIGSTLMIAKAVLELTPRQPSAIKDDTPQTAPESDRNHDPLSFQSPIRAHANNGPHDLPAGEMTSTRQDDAAAKSVDEVLSDCDRLHEQQQCEEEEKNLRRLLNRTSDSKLLAEIEWRIGRASNSRANLMCRNGGGPSKESKQDRESRIAVIREGYDHVVKAIELNDECSEAHKWAAILLAQYGGSLHESIKNAHKIREYGKRSVELNPEDPQSHYSKS